MPELVSRPGNLQKSISIQDFRYIDPSDNFVSFPQEDDLLYRNRTGADRAE
jgi:hypothetical protein